MAKRKYSGFSSKSFFNIVVLSVASLGLLVTTFALQNKTTTQSNASGAKYSCTKKPEIKLVATQNLADSVRYTLEVKNNDNHNPNNQSECKKDTYKIKANLPENWKVKMESDQNGYSNLLGIREGFSERISLTISPTQTSAEEKYNLTIKAINLNQNEDTNGSIALIYNLTEN